MMKRLLSASVFVVCALVLVAPAQAQTRSVYWNRWDVVISNVDTVRNQFDVREIYDVRFDGRFTFGSAVIPTDRLDSITNIQVYDGETSLQQQCFDRAGTYCVERSSGELSITYYFTQPVTDTTRHFEITYTVNGALRIYDGGDQLWWDAIPDEHFGFGIGSATVTVKLPQGYAPREGIDPVETYGAAGQVDVQGSVVTATAVNGVGPYDSFGIRVQYPHNPEAVAPSWQSQFDVQRTYDEQTRPLVTLALCAGSLVIGLGGSLWMIVRYRTHGRDPEVGVVPEYLSEPPSDLPAAVAGTLVDERADVRDVLSTILDLGQRGYLVIEEDQTEGFLGIGSKSTFTFKRTDKPVTGLREYEAELLQHLFSGNRMERTMDSLRNRFYTVIPTIQNSLYDETVKEGFFERSPQSVRSLWGVGGAVVVLVAVGSFFVLMGVAEEISGALIALPISIGVVGVVMLALSSVMPAKTRKGAEEAAKWRAFRQYLRNLEAYDNVENAADRLAEYIPYAVAFGIEQTWFRHFNEVTYAPLPPWYFPRHWGGPYSRGYIPGSAFPQNLGGRGGLPGDLARAGDGSLGDLSGRMSRGLSEMSASLTTMLNSASNVMTSRPQQSGGSGRWSSGGSSWSGGGFSGGGGSGGGSRGFG